MRKEQYQIDITASGFILSDFFTRVNTEIRQQDEPANCDKGEPVSLPAACDDTWRI